MTTFARAQTPLPQEAEVGQSTPAPATTLPPIPESSLKGVDSSARRQLTDEEIANQFFKNKVNTDQTNEVYLPFFYEKMQRALGRVKSRISSRPGGPTSLEVDGTALLAILHELIVDDWFKNISPTLQCEPKKQNAVKIDADGAPEEQPKSTGEPCWLAFSAFSHDQVKIDFNESALEIRAHVPPEFRKPRVSSLFKFESSELDEESDDPRWVSSYINMNALQVFRSDDPQYADKRQPLAAHFDSGTRLGRLALEANGRYLENKENSLNGEPSWVREDIRAVVDFPSSMIRTQVGDVIYPVRGYQAYRPMGGASIFTQFSMLPSQLTLPGGNYEIFLSRPSKVLVFINEQPIQVLDLPAGRHNLRDFPFASGLNDLRLEIADDLGRIETKNFTYFSNSELLKPGLHELSYSYGVPSTETRGERKYDSEKGTFSFFHRRGMTQNLTLGVNAQGDPIQNIFGMDLLMSTSIGYFSFEPAYSTNTLGRPGYAGKLRYILQEYLGKERSSRLSTLEVSGMSERFAPLGATGQQNISGLKIQATRSRSISKKMNFNLSLGYTFNRDTSIENDNSFNFSAGVSSRWWDGITTNLNFRHSRAPNGAEELSVMAFLIWSMPKERQFVTASHETSAGLSRADWTYQPTMGVGGVNAQVNVQRKADSSGYGASVDYTANRARIGLSEQIEIPEPDPNVQPQTSQKSVQLTTIRLGTALVMAGGHVSLSRPVTGAFAMLLPLKNLKGQNVQVNPQADESFTAQTDWLGPAVDPEIPTYTLSGISLGQKNLKAGTSLPRDHFLLKPSLHSGYAIEIGTDATVYLMTQLQNEDGTPAAMLAGQAVYLERAVPNVSVFTNRSGLLRSEGFRPGRYRLEIGEGEYEYYEFVIPSDKTEEYDMGVVKLKRKAQ